MPDYTVTLTDAEQKAMEYISTDVDFWIQNAVHERARLAMDELAANTVRETLATGGAVSGSVEDIVLGSELPNAQTRHDEMMEQMLSTQPPTQGADQ